MEISGFGHFKTSDEIFFTVCLFRIICEEIHHKSPIFVLVFSLISFASRGHNKVTLCHIIISSTDACKFVEESGFSFFLSLKHNCLFPSLLSQTGKEGVYRGLYFISFLLRYIFVHEDPAINVEVWTLLRLLRRVVLRVFVKLVTFSE